MTFLYYLNIKEGKSSITQVRLSMEKMAFSISSSILFIIVLFSDLKDHVSCLDGTGSLKEPTIKLPTLGVGVLDIKTDLEKENALVLALDAGYRMIDIWEGDEIPVKNAILRAKVPREEIFIVVKLSPPETVDQLYDTGDAVASILSRLETSYIDLLLMNYADFDNQHLRRWRAMISLKNRQKAKLIGVGNFNFDQVKLLGEATAVLPSVVQLEVNPFFQQQALVKNLTAKGIGIQAYSPLANANKLDDPRLVKIANKYDASTAQLLMQWCIQKGYSCITKSTKKNHLEDNINLGEFFIEDEDMKDLSSLEEGYVTNYDPNDPRFYEKTFYQARETEPEPKKGRRGDDLDDPKETDPYFFDGTDDYGYSTSEMQRDGKAAETESSKKGPEEVERKEASGKQPQRSTGETSEEGTREASGLLKGEQGRSRDEF